MKKQLLKVGLIIPLAVLTLAGCGLSPKEEFLLAHKEILVAKTAEVSTTINMFMELETDSDFPERKEIEDLVNSLEIKSDVLADINKNQYEVDLKASGMVLLDSVTEDLTVKGSFFLDGKTHKKYVKTDSAIEFLTQMAPIFGSSLTLQIPKESKEKVIEFDSTHQDIIGPKVQKKQKELAEVVLNSLTTFVTELPEEQFTEKNKTKGHFLKKDNSDVITFKVEGEKVVDLVVGVAKENHTLFGDLTEEQLDEELAEFKKQVKIGEVKVDAKIVKGHIKKAVFTIPVEIAVAGLDGEIIKYTLKVTNDYKSIDKPVEFTFDLDEKNIFSQSEFQEFMSY